MFVDDHNFDFNLSNESPCVDAGITDSIYNTFDFAGNIRVWDGNLDNDTIVDMGVFENSAPSPSLTNIKKMNVIENEMLAYPNPTNNFLKINISIGDIDQFRITNILGSILVTEQNLPSNGIIDLSRFQNGIYFITVQANDVYYSQKIIKQ